MEKYEWHIGAVAGPSLGSLMGPLTKAWAKLKASKAWKDASPWNGGIDDELRSFLNICGTQFPQIAQARPLVDGKASAVIDEHNLHPLPLPAQLKKAMVEQWILMREFFFKTSHDLEGCPPIEDYENWLFRWEEFMLNRLRPQVAPNQRKILDKIAKAEDANT